MNTARPLELVRDDDRGDTRLPPRVDESDPEMIGQPLPALDALEDLDLPSSDDIPILGERLGLSADTVTRMVRLARLREAHYRGKASSLEYASSDLQVERAFWALYENKTAYPRIPWPSVHAITGPLPPGTLVMLGARTGQGKTTFLLNLTDCWTEQGIRVTYLGLEQTPKELRTKWAALRAGVPPEVPLAHDESRLPPGVTLNDALSRVAEEMAWQAEGQRRHDTRFAPVKFVGRRQLYDVAHWAQDIGSQVLIVDHVDRLNHGEGRNPFGELSDTIRMTKELAGECGLVVLLASQAKRVSDKLEAFMPMDLSDLRGGGTKEEESDVVLTCYRPLAPGVTQKDLTAVRRGLLDRSHVLQPNTMAVTNLKARVNDSHLGRTARLRVWYGRVSEFTPPAGPPHTRSQHPVRPADEP